jgi:MFS transporter, DHA3 family, macrolide efflux protein
VFAISTVLFLQIPQPLAQDRLKQFKIQNSKFKNVREKFRIKRGLDLIWQEIIFGFHYIFSRPGLLALLITSSLFQFAHDIGAALYAPMILARSGNDAQVLGSVAAAAGVGGVVGAIFVSIKGVPKPRIHGLLLGMLGAGLSKIVFGLSRMPLMWISAQFCSSLNFPLISSSRDAIWLAQVKPQVQGRVFATRSVIMLITSAIAPLIAGTLADKVLEPAMMPGGSLTGIFGGIFGTDRGAGIALLYVIASFCLLVVGVSGYTSKAVREVENMLPDGALDFSDVNSK